MKHGVKDYETHIMILKDITAFGIESRAALHHDGLTCGKEETS